MSRCTRSRQQKESRPFCCCRDSFCPLGLLHVLLLVGSCFAALRLNSLHDQRVLLHLVNGVHQFFLPLEVKQLLETEKKRRCDETCVLTEMVQAAVNENARVALDQKEYQNKYDDPTTRYDSIKAEHDQVTARISALISTRTAVRDFINTLRGLPDKITEFSPESWGILLDRFFYFAFYGMIWGR